MKTLDRLKAFCDLETPARVFEYARLGATKFLCEAFDKIIDRVDILDELADATIANETQQDALNGVILARLKAIDARLDEHKVAGTNHAEMLNDLRDALFALENKVGLNQECAEADEERAELAEKALSERLDVVEEGYDDVDSLITDVRVLEGLYDDINTMVPPAVRGLRRDVDAMVRLHTDDSRDIAQMVRTQSNHTAAWQAQIKFNESVREALRRGPLPRLVMVLCNLTTPVTHQLGQGEGR